MRHDKNRSIADAGKHLINCKVQFNKVNWGHNNFLTGIWFTVFFSTVSYYCVNYYIIWKTEVLGWSFELVDTFVLSVSEYVSDCISCIYSHNSGYCSILLFSFYILVLPYSDQLQVQHSENSDALMHAVVFRCFHSPPNSDGVIWTMEYYY